MAQKICSPDADAQGVERLDEISGAKAGACRRTSMRIEPACRTHSVCEHLSAFGLWRRLGYTCCVIGTAAHVKARLRLSGNHLVGVVYVESQWKGEVII